MTDSVVADTAALIAFVRAEESARPAADRLFEDPWAPAFAGALSEPNARLLAVPCFREQVRLRTRFIDDFLTDGAARGLRQVVILGAGFDCRAMRLEALREAAVFEVDLPMQLARKRSILERERIGTPPGVRRVGCDFNEPGWETRLAAALAAAGFRREKPAAFVLEGVISYLDAPEIERTFRFMATAAATGSAAVFNFNLSRLDPADLHGLASATGFARASSASFEVLWRRYLEGPVPAGGEVFFVGEAST